MYDGDRLIRSVTRREPAYTEADRAELLALAVYREGLCPACGGPLDECTTQESMDSFYRATRVRCLRRDALSMSQAALGDIDRPEALVWSVSKIRR